jgi:hypothetical protein
VLWPVKYKLSVPHTLGHIEIIGTKKKMRAFWRVQTTSNDRKEKEKEKNNSNNKFFLFMLYNLSIHAVILTNFFSLPYSYSDVQDLIG